MDQKALRLECALAGPNVDVSRVPAKCWVEIKSMKLTRMILSGRVEEFEFTTPDGEYAFLRLAGRSTKSLQRPPA